MTDIIPLSPSLLIVIRSLTRRRRSHHLALLSRARMGGSPRQGRVRHQGTLPSLTHLHPFCPVLLVHVPSSPTLPLSLNP